MAYRDNVFNNKNLYCVKMSTCLLFLGLTSFVIALPTYDECSPSKTVCEYWFVVQKHVTMWDSKLKIPVYAKNGKLYSGDRSKRRDPRPIPPDNTITTDGFYRMVVTVNKTIPGPPIVVYKNQKLVIHVFNQLTSESTTIHWHGLHQRGTPFMDGLGYITQCPIGPGQKFTYKFWAKQTGTYWYHSHVGLQRSDGLYGAFIVKERPKRHAKPPTDVIMTVGDWDHLVADQVLIESVYGPRMNGRRIYPTHTADNVSFSDVPWVSGLINGRGRHTHRITGKQTEAPLTWFDIAEGEKYRFRVIQVGAMYPLRISVDGHMIEVVASDGCDVIPVKVESFIIFPGERYDFIIEGNQPFGNYWVRAESIENEFNHGVKAILHYKNADKEVEPTTQRQQCTTTEPCRILNCPFLFHPDPGRLCIPVSALKSTEKHELPPPYGSNGEEYFLNFAFPDYSSSVMGSVNGRKFVFPGVDALFENRMIGEFECEKNGCGKDKICSCTHQLNIPFNRTIQMVLMNMGYGSGAYHPIHLHGHSFHVLKMEFCKQDPKTGILYTEHKRNHPDIDCGGGLNYCNVANWKKKSWRHGNVPGLNLINPPRKDTIVIPPGGYAVVRIKSDNPGKWFMHCHVDVHMIGGMAVVISEAPERSPRPPNYFPRCNNFYGGNRMKRELSKGVADVLDETQGDEATNCVQSNSYLAPFLVMGTFVILLLVVVVTTFLSSRSCTTYRSI